MKKYRHEWKFLMVDLKHLKVMLKLIFRDHAGYSGVSMFWRYVREYAQARLKEIHE